MNQVYSQGGAGLVSAKLLRGARSCGPSMLLNSPTWTKLFVNRVRRLAFPSPGDLIPNHRALPTRRLMQEAGFEPVLIGNLAKERYLVQEHRFAGQHSQWASPVIAASLG